MFDDNDDTVRGHHDHERVDDAGQTTRGGLVIERRLPVWSSNLGLYGYCDVVERRGDEIVPVEYKTGKRFHYAATVQLAAQALCLEEMLGSAVPAGVIYTVGSNTRHPITIDADLRTAVTTAAKAVRRQVADKMPGPVADERCRRCSLNDRCLPSLVADPHRVSMLAAATKEL